MAKEYRKRYKNLPNCIDCGTELSGKKATRCSKCSKIVRITKVNANCDNCTKEIKVIPSKLKKQKNHYCSRRCQFEHRDISGKNNPNYGKGHKIQGEKNPNFKGWKSKEVYPIGFTDQLKDLIRIRDNNTCQICGQIQSNLKKKLHVHHVDYNKDNLSPKNLVSLCNSCHSKTNFDRKYWKKYFKNHNTIIQNKTMENILHDMKYMLKAIQKLKEVVEVKEKSDAACQILLNTCDKMYQDILSMSKKKSPKGGK